MIRPKGFLLLGAVLALLLLLPAGLALRLRSGAVRALAPGGAAHASRLDELELENRRLQVELAHLTALLEQAKMLDGWELPAPPLPARVVYRQPASWGSSLWINVGARDGVALESPVVKGEAIVGVVDVVGERCSRVRLITDSALCPAVRVLREGQLLAKGELHGSGRPLWQSGGNTLLGVGFNYDFADAAGPARDLRTGVPIGEAGDPIPILLPGDQLITTGLDGVFPAGLAAAQVQEVGVLREGAYKLDLTAIPAAGDLNELDALLVLKPRSGRPVG